MTKESSKNSSKRRRIEETVLRILKVSRLETTSESRVRAAAAKRLGFRLSKLTHRRLVHQLVHSFLVSNAASVMRPKSVRRNNDGGDKNDGNAERHGKGQQQLTGVGAGSKRKIKWGKVICKLSKDRRVTVHDVDGTIMVAIREFDKKDEKIFPRTGVNSGINLTATQWSSFRKSFSSIEEAIVKLKSRSRPINASNSQEHVPAKRKREEAGDLGAVTTSKSQEKISAERKQTKDDGSTLTAVIPSKEQVDDTVNALHPDQLIPTERKQTHSTKADIHTAVPTCPSQENLHPQRLIPIQTVRLDGRNYHSWRRQMEFFLNQLNIGYVLTEPCPNISVKPEASLDEKVKVKAAVQRWTNDDCMCRHTVLNSLCDSLFQVYSQKTYSARELWEELNAYNEDLGTKRSQISKYIHFQMVDGISVFQQAQEIHEIANAIMASGIWMDETFHVSVIVSKLPPSWKEFRVRMMREEFLPLNMLMHRLRVQDESRNNYQKEANYNKGHTLEQNLDGRLGMRSKETKKVCYGCGKEGHIIKYCPDRKSEPCEKSNEKGSGVLSADTSQKRV